MAIREDEQALAEPIRRAVTVRSIAIGVMCAGFLAWGGHFTRHIAHTTKMAQDHLPWGAVVPFLLITVVLNNVLEKVKPEWGLRPSELLGNWVNNKCRFHETRTEKIGSNYLM